MPLYPSLFQEPGLRRRLRLRSTLSYSLPKYGTQRPEPSESASQYWEQAWSLNGVRGDWLCGEAEESDAEERWLLEGRKLRGFGVQEGSKQAYGGSAIGIYVIPRCERHNALGGGRICSPGATSVIYRREQPAG